MGPADSVVGSPLSPRTSSWTSSTRKAVAITNSPSAQALGTLCLVAGCFWKNDLLVNAKLFMEVSCNAARGQKATGLRVAQKYLSSAAKQRGQCADRSPNTLCSPVRAA